MNQLPSFGVSGGIVKHDGLSVSRRQMLSHNAFRGAVVRQDHFEQPATWLASVNAAYLGEYLDREAAMDRVEAEVEQRMELTLHDWELYWAGKEKEGTTGR
jgi:hypothetical protein